MMKNLVIAAISGAVALMISGQGIAADLDAGQSKAAEVCASCHGTDGKGIAPNFPHIGGQHRTYIAKALTDYKSGDRKDPIMNGMTAALSEEDIDNLAFYYSSQSGNLTMKR
jgi:cytochrome c553